MSHGFAYHPRNRYSRWDGTQQIDTFNADEIMDALADDVMSDGSVNRALQRLFQRGSGERDGGFPGMRQLMERLRQQRQRDAQRYDLGPMLEQLREQLREIQTMERMGIADRVQEGRDRLAQQQAAADAAAAAAGQEAGSADGQHADGSEGAEGAESSQQSTQGGQQESQSGASSSGSSGSNSDDGSSEQFDYTPQLQQLLERLAQRHHDQLDALPIDPAGQIEGLQNYDFMDPQAREAFDQLVESLRQQVLNSTAQSMQQSLRGMTPEDIQSTREMLKELNEMLEARQRGEEPDFERFMHRHGHHFGNDIHSLDELMDRMAQQMATMQHLMDSMTPEQRAELWAAMQAVMDDEGIQQEMNRLGQHLSQMMPSNPYAQSLQQSEFGQEIDLSLQEAMRMMGRLDDMDELEDQLSRVRDWRDLEHVDDAKLTEMLGDAFQRDVDQLRQLTKILEDAGYIQRSRRGYEMTPRGVRKIGQKALSDIFKHLKRDRIGNHEMPAQGGGGERVDASKPYEFGDPFLLDLPRTLMNSLSREGVGSPARLQASDFEVYRTEHITRSATVLMIDMSRSMLYNDCDAAARKVALALDSLIRTQYPRDELYILGFSYMATRVKPSELASLNWNESQYGTNLQHGLMLARQLLAPHKGGNRQIIVITDGEPTAHMDNGQVHFSYPPTWETLRETLREVQRCTREQITINTFMLERSRYMESFISEMARINNGRAFFATPDRLGEYILVDYVANKRKIERA